MQRENDRVFYQTDINDADFENMYVYYIMGNGLPNPVPALTTTLDGSRSSGMA